MKCPCKGCDKRTITCHGSCTAYKDYKEWLDEVNKERAKQQTCKDLPNACKKAWWKRLKERV